VNERSERRQLALELAALEARWQQAEELAAIVDEELSADRPSLGIDPEE
jgi:hypothetical protein